jgi:hypothetical protein
MALTEPGSGRGEVEAPVRAPEGLPEPCALPGPEKAGNPPQPNCDGRVELSTPSPDHQLVARSAAAVPTASAGSAYSGGRTEHHLHQPLHRHRPAAPARGHRGEGPPLLLIHGWPQTWYAWGMLMPTVERALPPHRPQHHHPTHGPGRRQPDPLYRLRLRHSGDLPSGVFDAFDLGLCRPAGPGVRYIATPARRVGVRAAGPPLRRRFASVEWLDRVSWRSAHSNNLQRSHPR